jgi:hypothetical protein
MSLLESEFIVYRWEAEEMRFARRLYIRHEIGQQVTAEMVAGAMMREVYDFPAAKYRVIRVRDMIDVEVKAEVVLS